MPKNSRLIRAEKLVIALSKKFRNRLVHYDDLMATIADAPTVDAVEVVQKWIPVTERLPKESEDVLAFGYYHETFQALICHYRTDFKGQWFTSVAGQQVYEVTHWMPLPEPPKGE